MCAKASAWERSHARSAPSVLQSVTPRAQAPAVQALARHDPGDRRRAAGDHGRGRHEPAVGDSALVRLLLLSVLLRLMGGWTWYLPQWADRLLPDVRFGHA
jgi:hypothetical protein